MIVTLLLENRTIELLQGSWDSISNHHAPLYGNDEDSNTDSTLTRNVDATIQAYLDGGAPASKLVMGIPLYGYGWKGKGLLSSSDKE